MVGAVGDGARTVCVGVTFDTPVVEARVGPITVVVAVASNTVVADRIAHAV